MVEAFFDVHCLITVSASTVSSPFNANVLVSEENKVSNDDVAVLRNVSLANHPNAPHHEITSQVLLPLRYNTIPRCLSFCMSDWGLYDVEV